MVLGPTIGDLGVRRPCRGPVPGQAQQPRGAAGEGPQGTIAAPPRRHSPIAAPSDPDARQEMHPRGLQEAIHDKSGHLPLHCALLNDCTGDGNDDWIDVERHGTRHVTAFLIQQHPEAVRTRTSNGYLPLQGAFADADFGEPSEAGPRSTSWTRC
jgi:hypothetical protein